MEVGFGDILSEWTYISTKFRVLPAAPFELNEQKFVCGAAFKAEQHYKV